jgi:hypothetical protein
MLGAGQVRGVRAGALLIAAAAAGIALWHLPGRFRAVNGEVRRFATVPLDERRLMPARSVDVDTRVYVAARATIPLGDTYAVITGPGIAVSTRTTFDAVAPFADFYLYPRRQVPDPRAARWVISYGGDVSRIGRRISRVVDVEQGVQIAELSG